MKPMKISKLSLKKNTIAVLSSAELSAVAGGCTDDSSGDGLLCPKFAPTTRKTIVK